MLKALGIGKKSAPPSEDAVKKYRDQQSLRNQWRSDTQKVEAIISKLAQEYELQKGDFALSRYERLKNMIKSAIKEYLSLIEAGKNRASEKYEAKVKNHQEESRGVVGGGAGGSKKGAISQLKNSASHFAGHNEERQKDYHDMSTKEIEEDLTRFRREILQYKAEYRGARDKLDRLNKSYEDSKKFSPPQRYNELKNMIKEITRSPDLG